MIRLLAAAVVVLTAVSSADAALTLSILNRPATYSPGDSFMVQVAIEDVVDLGSFNLELQLSSTAGIAGVDFGFAQALLAPTGADYVFDGNMIPFPFFAQTPSDDGTDAFLAVTDAFDADGDFATDGVDVAAGAPRLLAEATIFTTAGAGDLTLSFGGLTSLISSDSVGGGAPIDITGATFSGGGAVTAVPEPSSAAILGLGMAAFCLLRRRRRTSGT